jgi:hypothetical protein
MERVTRTRTRRKKLIVDFIDGSSDTETQENIRKNVTSRKRKKNPTSDSKIPQIAEPIVELEDYLESQESRHQNNPSQLFMAAPNQDIIFEFIDEQQDDSVLNPVRQDAVFEFEGDEAVSEPPRKRANVLNPTPHYDSIDNPSQGKLKILYF